MYHYVYTPYVCNVMSASLMRIRETRNLRDCLSETSPRRRCAPRKDSHRCRRRRRRCFRNCCAVRAHNTNLNIYTHTHFFPRAVCAHSVLRTGNTTLRILILCPVAVHWSRTRTRAHCNVVQHSRNAHHPRIAQRTQTNKHATTASCANGTRGTPFRALPTQHIHATHISSPQHMFEHRINTHGERALNVHALTHAARL